jgi:hypothetical protein
MPPIDGSENAVDGLFNFGHGGFLARCQWGIGAWSEAQLRGYLSYGHADARGSAGGPMAEVVDNSLRFLNEDDIRAMSAYLMNVPAVSATGAAAVRTPTTQDQVSTRLPRPQTREGSWRSVDQTWNHEFTRANGRTSRKAIVPRLNHSMSSVRHAEQRWGSSPVTLIELPWSASTSNCLGPAPGLVAFDVRGSREASISMPDFLARAWK